MSMEQKREAIVQATIVTYELHSLGWKAFQDLCTTITGEVLGQTVQAFHAQRDGGRDGAFFGSWKTDTGEGIKESFTVQCKFSSTRDKFLALSELREEMEKAKRLAERRLCENYILMTNQKVSGVEEARIRDAFLGIKGIECFLLFGYEWIVLKIRESSRLRMLVPRVYGLGDLSQILDERAYSQAQDILSSLGDDLAKFVLTEAYRKSARALMEHGFVLLLGEPASGKSTIAAGLALGAIDIWGCFTLKIRDADEFVQHWNSNEPRQFFWVDDAFGATQYQSGTAKEWNRVFPHMAAAIKKGARVLFTSRDYIYRAAKADLKVGAFPLINESQVVINIQELSKAEKEQILYNHIKLGNQGEEFRQGIKPFLPSVAASSHFLPEIARRLGNSLFTKNLIMTREGVVNFVERPLELLIDVVGTLDRECRAAIALVFMNGGSMDSPLELMERDEQVLKLLGGTTSGVREALQAMNGSLVRIVQSEGRSRWTYKHPTIVDAFATIVAEDPELLDIYLIGTRVDKVIEEVTCGNVGLEGVKVIIPESRYESIIDRLTEVEKQDKLYTFLSSRCERVFLECYIGKNKGLYEAICCPASYLGISKEVALLSKLHAFDLLPEKWRNKFIYHAGEQAIVTPDADFINDPVVRSLFREEEVRAILDRVRVEVIPRLSGLISDWESSFSDGPYVDPASYFEPLVEALRAYRKEFCDDGEVVSKIDDGLEKIQETIVYMPYGGEDPWYEDDYPDVRSSPGSAERSVFDDVDQ